MMIMTCVRLITAFGENKFSLNFFSYI